MDNYKIKTIITSTRDRLPLLINSNNGKPDMLSTLYILTQIRSQGKAVETIKYTLQNISFFKIILQKQNLNEELLIKRFNNGKLFHSYELESIIENCKFKLEDILKEVPDQTQPSWKQEISLNSLEKYIIIEPKIHKKFVDKNTAANRLRTIRDYVLWLGNIHISKMDLQSLEYIAIKDFLIFLKKVVELCIPSKSNNSFISGKEGLSNEERDLLFSIINRNSKENPFRGDFIKSRNEVIFVWLFKFGLRHGELLNVKISDIDFRKKQLTIIKHSDDLDDPRQNQPNVKTRSRILTIPDIFFMKITEHYILEHRINIKESKKHEFLIISSTSDAPP